MPAEVGHNVFLVLVLSHDIPRWRNPVPGHGVHEYFCIRIHQNYKII